MGKAEEILPTVIQRTTKPNVIVVVDPPRAGLRKFLIIQWFVHIYIIMTLYSI